MRRHNHGFRPPGVGGGRGMPAAQPPQQPISPNVLLQNPNIFLQNPTFPYIQSPNYPLQNPTFSFQNPNIPNFLPQNADYPILNPNFAIQNANYSHQQYNNEGFSTQSSSQKSKESLERMDRAVIKARRDLIAARESVSAWKVSAAALLALHVDSWSSLGFQMQEVPSLHQLMVTEGKINAFINCFVGVRRITSLYDLEVAICKTEGVELFEKLELGPLVRHPLVLHYFSVNSDVATVCKITSGEIISYLYEFMYTGKRREIKAEEFLDFIAEKRSVMGREKLGVRIQSLGMHVTFIREARRLENDTLNDFLKAKLRQKSDIKSQKRPLFSKQKKQLDERFSAISKRIESFSSVNEDFHGKHIRFVSSSSEDNDSGDDKSEDDDDARSHCKLSSENIRSCDQVSRCPYPSATEEIARLGLKVEMDSQPSPASSSLKSNKSSGLFKRKRKSENVTCIESAPTKFPKREYESSNPSADNNDETQELSNSNEDCNSLSYSCLRLFITTWKEACRDQTVSEVFDRMLAFYKTTPRRRKKIKSMFLSYPYIGLLHVAITSIKCGMWDSIYDTFEAICQHGLSNKLSDTSPKYESIDVEPSVKEPQVINECISEHRHCVTVEDIAGKITAYFELDHENLSNERSHLEMQLILYRKLQSCEVWLSEQYSVKEFNSLGYGEFFAFLQKNVSVLPNELVGCLIGETREKSPFEVCMLKNQLLVLLSQSLNNLWGDETITQQKISVLLMRQFPLVSFDIIENGSTGDFKDIIKDQSSVISKCILFSEPLSGSCDFPNSLAHNEMGLLEIPGLKNDTGEKIGILGPVASKDAIEVLLKAPMLSDLNVWSHWDLRFAPSLGPLVKWLLNEVNTKELLCLVTKDGKVVRINHSSTMDSFLEASLQGSPFRTAVELVSLLSLYGGKRHVPLSLLKSHTRQAFEVILQNQMGKMDIIDSRIFHMPGKASKEEIVDDDAGHNSSCESKSTKTNRTVLVASRFFLDCLGYLPLEFCSFAADVLLSGFRCVTKDAPSAILCECNQTEERIMLHDIGMSLGIVEWIDDYHTLASSNIDLFNPSGISYLKAPGSEFSTTSESACHAFAKLPCSEGERKVCVEAERHILQSSQFLHMVDGPEISSDKFGSDCLQQLSGVTEQDAALVIESIRREEFGLDANVSATESSLLKKQHARLGRALHCLSQELYSQDSHFLLELVQNADDNIYLENVEPTLTFILQKTGIIVLNNEQGFSAQNIRALCDVGNSTKKGSGAGYIGQKGIGFKSVFRVTDTPEIHSNGFHVKFDTSEGQIGFVLPTVVPPCNIDLFSKLASGYPDQMDANCWNTCILLPFSLRLSEGISMNNIMTMFSDLHPSLLLFLHRLRCIKFRNLLNNSLIIMRKEVVGDGIVKVSHGNEKMSWLVVSQKLKADAIRTNVQTTEISIAFTLRESDTGYYAPHLEQQPVFAFLPLRAYGLKFILQGDFILPSSREEVDGDSPWNQWLLSEYPGLFVCAERSFCALPCFRENSGKAVAAYLSFVPLVGEVHGFFSSLPRMIISKLRMSNCLLLDGDSYTWVPPCKVLRNWNEQARSILPDGLLLELLGLGFLEKNIIVSDPLARALGIEEYGPKILLQFMSALCDKENGLKSMGLGWLCSWLAELYTMSFLSSGKSSLSTGVDSDIIKNLRKIAFVPVSGGTYVSVDDGTIWLQSDALSSGFDGEHGLEAFPNLCANLRTISPALLAAAAVADDISCKGMSLVDNITWILHRIGVKRLSTHEIVKVHVLPSICDDRITSMDKSLMTEYLAFVMLHLQYSCPNCRVEREHIISELRNKALILTSYGYKRPVEVAIHFGKQYGNPIDVNKLINAIDFNWHEVDTTYLKHPITTSLSSGLTKWREFFLELGITDFVHVVQVEKSAADVSNTLLNNTMWNRELISLGSVAKDWESDELVNLLSLLSNNRNQEKCKYMLEVLDTLWDHCYSDKSLGYCNFKSSSDSKPFKSSFMRSICDIRWVVSSMDNELHCPNDLFYDCDAVRLVLGASAPYAIPKVKSENLLGEIGFKTQVTLDDILEIIQLWRKSETPFKASIAQMSRLYTFVWNEISMRKKVMEEFLSGPFIFVPYVSALRQEDLVPGKFLTPEEVCWHDSTCSMVQTKLMDPCCSSTSASFGLLNKTLDNLYPGLHEFFVNVCGVREIPPLCSYLQILQQLSTIALPSQAASVVFQVFLKWADGLKSGLLSSEDSIHIKDCLVKLEFTVLPTVLDKWVSLHPSFGLVCWCDDENLRNEFKHVDNIDFIYFGELSDDEKELLGVKVSVLLQSLQIPSLSEVVTREAIYYGLTNTSFKASLVDWILPYAQRYIYNLHHERYSQLKQSGLEILDHFRIIVVEKLFYRNVIKRCDNASKKRFECKSLLQGDIFYTTEDSDSHSIFMELSRLFFYGTPELHLANFLHMISTMVESGSTEEQTEFFILNSQKLPKLPDKESLWSIPSMPASTESDEILQTTDSSLINDQNPSKSKRKPRINSSWPPVDWKTAPGFSSARANGFRKQAPISQPSSGSYKKSENFEFINAKLPLVHSIEMDADWTIQDDSEVTMTAYPLPNSETMEDQSDYTCIQADSCVDVVFDPVDLSTVSEGPELDTFNFSKRAKLNVGNPNATQALLTGRLGELLACKYFVGKLGKTVVKWVNEVKETGLPYDIVIEKEDNNREYIEVKATKSARKDWFMITTNEWQFAVEKGESFSVAHVVLLGNNVARIAIFKNPARLCQLGKLQLVVMMPKQQREFSIVS